MEASVLPVGSFLHSLLVGVAPTFGGDDPLHTVKEFTKLFTSILYEAMPYVVLGSIIAGMLEELVPQQFVARIIPRRRTLAIAISGFLGLIFPMCECGIVPVMRRLLRKGLPLSCCVCYMMAGPIVNVVVLMSTYVAFSGMENLELGQATPWRQLGSLPIMLLRAGLGYLVACGTSLVVDWQYRKYGNDLLAPLAIPPALPSSAEANSENNGRRPWLTRFNNITETALHDFIDITVFLIIGALIASSTRLAFSREQIFSVSGSATLAIGLMMALAVVLCLCSEADAFVGASYSALAPSAKLAFLVLGPMLDLKLYMMFTRVFRPRLIWTIILCAIVQVFVYTNVLHGIIEGFPSLVVKRTLDNSQ